MKRKASFFVIVSSLLLLVGTGVAKSNSREDSPQACGPKFSLVPSDNIRPSSENRLNAVATNGDQVVAVGFYRKPLSDLKSGLIEVWDDNEGRMKAYPVNLGGFESEFNWITADPNGGFKLVATVWEMTPKGRKSQIVVGRFDGQQFVREATIAIPGAVRNIPHRILVSGSTTWVDGYFTRIFGEVPTTSGEIGRPYPYLPPYTKGNAKTYPLLVQATGASWRQIPFPGEGWLDGMASREPDRLVVVGMGRSKAGDYLKGGDYVAVAHELQGGTWQSGEFWPGGKVSPINKLIQAKAFLDVVLTPSELFPGKVVLSYFDIVFNRNFRGEQSGLSPEWLIEYRNVAGGWGFGVGFSLPPSVEATRARLSPAPIKVLIPSLPGHKGERFYGIEWPFVYGVNGRVGQAILYPGYRESDYPFYFKAQSITTTRTEVWVVGSLSENESEEGGHWQTAVLRACPPLKVVAGTETPPATETP